MRLVATAASPAMSQSTPPAASLSNPLTLDDAIRLALQNNQRVKVSAFSPQIGRANVLAAYGAFDPALTFRRTYSEAEAPGALAPLVTRALTKTDDYALSLDGLMPWGLTYSIGATANNARDSFASFAGNYVTFGGVSVTQPLLRGFGFGATLANLRVAKANRGISDWQHKQTVIDVVTNVIFAFNGLQQARENLKIAILSRDGAAQLLSENEKRRAVGATSDAEVVQARARVANREESILFADRAVRDVENQFRLLIGDAHFQIDGAALDIAELATAADVAVDVAADLKKAYDLRPDYQAARLGLAIDRANYSLAQNQLLPRLDFVGSYGYSGANRDFPTARDQVRDEDARSYSVGMVVRVPLAFAEGRGRARAAKLNLRQGEADLVRLEQDIAIAVTSAAAQIETTKQRVAADKAAYELAQLALDNEQKRFKAGTSTTFFVLQQQEQLSAAQNAYSRALADQRRAIATYERELGVTLATHRITVE
ncbi:MAG TPA: TolC family protein [Opitutaceae bacterium]|nr:TolC family protein [Opitutaceae bacterium]